MHIASLHGDAEVAPIPVAAEEEKIGAGPVGLSSSTVP
jgi:hypothetical protein